MLNKYRSHILVFLAGVSWSTLAIFSVYATHAKIDPFNQVFWRFVVSIVCAYLVARFIFNQKFEIKSKKELGYLAINGLLFVLGFTTFTASIFLGTPIAKAVALNYSYPVPVIILSYLIFKDKPTLKNIFAIVICFVSIYLLLELWKVKGLTGIETGDVFAWLNSFAFAGIIVWGTKIRQDLRLHPVTTLFYSWLFSLPILIVLSVLLSRFGFTLFLPELKFNFDMISWGSLLGLGTVSSVLPISLMYFGATKLKAFVTSILLLSEPIFVYIVGIILFQQQLSIWGILGALGILIAVLFT